MLFYKRFYFMFCCLLIVLFGCKSTTSPTLTVSGLAFYNDANSTIENIKLTVVESAKMVSCNLVEPQSYCGTGFPQARYQGADLVLSWQTSQGQIITRPVLLKQPQKFDASKRYAAVIKFTDPTNFEAFFTVNPRPF
ncbi:hypothetical protein AAEU29_02645 [Pseudoalteromonas sp. SSM20]|uniref:hypothetical protein n=1 Tax=Pseudoalteromonas sp. SSM20 TaxID=3139394 RepID=UPI003BAA3C6F